MFYFVVHCDVCTDGYGCSEFSWVKNSQEDGEFFNTKEEAEEAAYTYIGDSPYSFIIQELDNMGDKEGV